MYVKNSIKLFSIFSTAQKLPKIFTEFFGKCKNFHKKIRKNKRKTFQSPICCWQQRMFSPEPLVGVFDASSPFQKDSLKPILKFTLHVSSATLKAARFPSQSTSCQRFDWITIQDILPIAEIFMNQIVFVVALLFHPKG